MEELVYMVIGYQEESESPGEFYPFLYETFEIEPFEVDKPTSLYYVSI